MSSRTACLAGVTLFALQGCRITVHYAIVAPNESLSDDRSCLRQCQRMHAGQTEKYLACLRNCQGIGIFDGQQCKQLRFDAELFQCSTENTSKVNPTVLLLALLAVAAALLVARAVVALHPPYMSSD